MNSFIIPEGYGQLPSLGQVSRRKAQHPKMGCMRARSRVRTIRRQNRLTEMADNIDRKDLRDELIRRI
jgi:hypothetical protein